MRIPKPSRRTAGRPLAFHAICPGCQTLQSLDDGIWPQHLWWKGGPACVLSNTKHESIKLD